MQKNFSMQKKSRNTGEMLSAQVQDRIWSSIGEVTRSLVVQLNLVGRGGGVGAMLPIRTGSLNGLFV